MKIFSVALGPHDHNTYDGVFHNQIERYSRKKHNIPWHVDSYPHHSEAERMNSEDKKYTREFYDEYFKPDDHEVLAFTVTVGGIKSIPHHQINQEFLDWKPKHLWDYKMIGNQYYIDHHQSHAAYALLDSAYHTSDVLAIDGRGWNYNCIFVDKTGNITDLSDKMNIGILWNYFSKRLGFGNLGASKLMGLSAYGEYNIAIHLAIENENYDYLLNAKKEDIAATLQYHTIDLIKRHIFPLKSCDNICIAGGVAYNGYMNEEFTKHYKSVYVPPAPGDEGQALGTYMHAQKMLNYRIHFPSKYSGKEYEFVGDKKVNLETLAWKLQAGKIVGWFQGKSESGHRALGNRSILASPCNPNIKDIINKTIKHREDFRPFAPVILQDHAHWYFDITQPSPYMSRIVKAKDSAKESIPGVIHVDGTSRVQTVNEQENPKLYELLLHVYQATGHPILLNTSFNCREPIVETPEQAINTFNKTALDILVINEYYIAKVT
jgi:carbamoyltransferase